ncbi:MAG: 4-(cytidine 5'-diphospho)-2-C-methyl-D-erythritol kinase [Candidatus Omnitrophota bacterium]
MNSIILKAPAKVNLYLKILRKRTDGFHDIVTLFERIGLYDTVTIQKIPQKKIIVTSNTFIVRKQADNLAHKAAVALIERYRIDEGVRIHVEKRIPIGSGLGGGSSDAAYVLLGMNKLFGLKLSQDRLIRLGRLFGSDIGFFLLNKSFAIGKGKGDRLSGLRSRRKFWHLLMVPGFKCSTKEIYQASDLTLTKKNVNVTIKCLKDLGSRTGGLISVLHNDLQHVVVSKKKAVGTIIERLAKHSNSRTIISGSGPSVFCLFKTRKEAVRARERFVRRLPAHQRKGLRIFIVRTA